MHTRLEQLGLTALAAAIYYFTFKLNQYLDPWFFFTQGISLLFLPAGVKHVSILLAGRWGALGSFLGLLFMVPSFWPELHLALAIVYVAISTLATCIGISLSLRLLGISTDLNNLKLLHLPILDLITTLLHAVMTTGFFVLAGLKSTSDWGLNAMAMMLGDYLGSLCLMLMLFIGLQWLPRKPIHTL